MWCTIIGFNNEWFEVFVHHSRKCTESINPAQPCTWVRVGFDSVLRIFIDHTQFRAFRSPTTPTDRSSLSRTRPVHANHSIIPFQPSTTHTHTHTRDRCPNDDNHAPRPTATGPPLVPPRLPCPPSTGTRPPNATANPIHSAPSSPRICKNKPSPEPNAR